MTSEPRGPSAAPPARILLVEDDGNLLDAYRVVLSAAGLEVATASTAETASERLRDDPADVVVLDLGLPDLSGPELVARLRREAPGARLVVLTGRTGEEIRARCAAAGADDFLVKPVSGSELAEELGG